jgi:thiosulfate/3-mercaptopyruvate sulfurtransferase
VVYAEEAPMATRLLFTLAYFGVREVAYLDGGLEQWRDEGRAVATGGAVPASGHGAAPMLARRAELLADASYLQSRIGQPGTSIVDTRTRGEYEGTGNRSGMPSLGHVAGARQLEWEELFSDGKRRLKPRAELERLYRERVRPGDAVVTYCWVGYRASATWFVASLLGYEARLYDGSYQDWSQRALPTNMGSAP